MNMRHFVAVILCLMVLSGCGAVAPQTEEKPIVVETIGPLGALLREIVGDAVKVETLMPPGASPHTFEPKPSDLVNASKARLIVANGVLDDWVTKVAGGVEVVKLFDAMMIISSYAPIFDDENNKGELFEINPHYFIDPIPIKIFLYTLEAKLSEKYPEITGLSERVKKLTLDLDLVVSNWKAKFANLKGKKFFATHATYPYLARTIGMGYAGAVQEFPGREPTPAWIAQLDKRAKDEGVGYIIIEPELPNQAAETIAKEAGLTVIRLSPNTAEGTYTKYIEDLLSTIYKAMK